MSLDSPYYFFHALPPQLIASKGNYDTSGGHILYNVGDTINTNHGKWSVDPISKHGVNICNNQSGLVNMSDMRHKLHVAQYANFENFSMARNMVDHGENE